VGSVGHWAGNALSMAAARACLGEVLTDEAFTRMETLAVRLVEQAGATITRHGMPWTITRLGRALSTGSVAGTEERHGVRRRR